MVTVQKSDQPKLSVKSSEIIANGQFPLLARFAYGKNYPRLTGFSKLLTLLDSFQVCAKGGAWGGGGGGGAERDNDAHKIVSNVNCML